MSLKDFCLQLDSAHTVVPWDWYQNLIIAYISFKDKMRMHLSNPILDDVAYTRLMSEGIPLVIHHMNPARQFKNPCEGVVDISFEAHIVGHHRYE